jgi:hypothetical protein
LEENEAMRKRYRVPLLAVLVAAFVVPVGFALSLESPSALTPHPVVATASPTLAVPSAPRAEARELPPVPDAAKLLLVGTVLFGLAAFVRKAT